MHRTSGAYSAASHKPQTRSSKRRPGGSQKQAARRTHQAASVPVETSRRWQPVRSKPQAAKRSARGRKQQVSNQLPLVAASGRKEAAGSQQQAAISKQAVQLAGGCKQQTARNKVPAASSNQRSASSQSGAAGTKYAIFCTPFADQYHRVFVMRRQRFCGPVWDACSESPACDLCARF